jgi:deoxyadenosine/deoxycytidine kinase
MSKIHISIEGMSGAGKSEAGKLLALPPLVYKVNKALPEPYRTVKFFEERAGDNPFLKDFYSSGMAEEYAFASQMFYLQARFVTNVAIKKWDGGIALEDRSIYGDMTFAENLYNMGRLSSDSFKEYMRIKEAIWNKYGLKGPDGIILLSVSLDTSLKRLRERGTGEKIDEKYWESLLYLYESKFKEIKKTIPVIEIDANIDFWQDESYMYNIAKEVNSLVKKI